LPQRGSKEDLLTLRRPSTEAIRGALRSLNAPTDGIVEVGKLRPEMFVQRIQFHCSLRGLRSDGWMSSHH
jgi:hypothetical protein